MVILYSMELSNTLFFLAVLNYVASNIFENSVPLNRAPIENIIFDILNVADAYYPGLGCLCPRTLVNLT